MHYLNEQNIFLFLIQILILLGCARGLGEVFRRWRQPPLTAEILVGIILGPTLFGRFFPQLHRVIFPPDIIQQNMLETVAWLGVLFLLLETGLEIDFSSAWRQRGDALKIALSDIIIPMVVAFIPCFFLPVRYLQHSELRLIFALFMSTVMTISAMPVAARALHDLKLSKTDLGFLIMSALSVNDIIGWLIFTLILGLFTQATLHAINVALIISTTVGFTILCLTIGRNFSNFVISKINEKQMPQPGTSLTFICLLGLLCGAITQKIGIHALFGFFMAGIMAGEARALSERTRQIISQMVYAIFVPLFFAGIGLKIDFLSNFDVFLVLLITVIGIVGRFLGAWVGVYFTKQSRENQLSIAIAHTPGGAMEIVVGVLALEYNLISETVFIAIVVSAIFSCLTLGPWLNYSIKKRKRVSMLEYISPRLIISDLKADSRDKAIYKLCEIVAEQEDIPDVENLYYAILDREYEMGTAIEEGIALPHARCSLLRRAVIAVGRTTSGIEWNSPDGKPTRIIFLIITPQDDEGAQVQILAYIARAMSNEQIRNSIMKAHDAQEMWRLLQDAFNSRHVARKSTTSSA